MDFYQGYEDLIEFSTATMENAFGSQLLALCERKFDNIETAVAILTEGLDELGFEVDEEGVVGLMTGEVLPSEEVLEALAGLADSDADVQRLYNSAAVAYDVAATLLEDGEVEIEDEDEDFEYEEDEDAETTGEVDYFDEDEDEVEVEEDLAAQLYSRQVITDYLNDYVEVADQMLAGGKGLMTPQIKELLFGKSDKNRFMNFSAVVEDGGYTAEEYLKCIEFSLNLLSELDGIDGVYFESQISDEISDSNISFSRSDNSDVEAEARQMLEWLSL